MHIYKYLILKYIYIIIYVYIGCCVQNLWNCVSVVSLLPCICEHTLCSVVKSFGEGSWEMRAQALSCRHFHRRCLGAKLHMNNCNLFLDLLTVHVSPHRATEAYVDNT